MAQKPVRYQCNQPRSVRAGNLAPEVVRFSPFRSHVTLCFLWWWTSTSLFMSLFLTPDPSQTEILGTFVEKHSELSDFHQSVRSVNECECKKKHRKICAKGSDIITDVICASQHFASTFSMQIFQFQRRTTERRGVICDGKRSENLTADRTSRLWLL